METIKRYSNRKLYSNSLSKYVNLDYIADLVRTETKFTVTDNATKKDITKKTLRQALLTVDLPSDTVLKLIRGI